MEKQHNSRSYYLPRTLVGRVHFDENAPGNPPAPPANPEPTAPPAPPQNQPPAAPPAGPQNESGKPISDAAFRRLSEGVLNDPERLEAMKKLIAGEEIETLHTRVVSLETEVAQGKLQTVLRDVRDKYNLSPVEMKGLEGITDPAKLDAQGAWIKEMRDSTAQAIKDGLSAAQRNGSPLPPFPGEATAGMTEVEWSKRQFAEAYDRGVFGGP